jgi:hypothetical protein
MGVVPACDPIAADYLRLVRSLPRTDRSGGARPMRFRIKDARIRVPRRWIDRIGRIGAGGGDSR